MTNPVSKCCKKCLGFGRNNDTPTTYDIPLCLNQACECHIKLASNQPCDHTWIQPRDAWQPECHKCGLMMSTVESVGEASNTVFIDPLAQLLMRFYEDVTKPNPEGMTHLINYSEWAERMRKVVCDGFEAGKAYMDFLEVGGVIACGHCEPEKYGEGLKLAERTILDFKCVCKCHEKAEPPEKDWEKEFDEKFVTKNYQDGWNRSTYESGPKSIKSFIRSKKSEWESEAERRGYGRGRRKG